MIYKQISKPKSLLSFEYIGSVSDTSNINYDVVKCEHHLFILKNNRLYSVYFSNPSRPFQI